MRDGHLDCTSAAHQRRLYDYVPSDTHSVLQISLHLVQHVFASATKNYRAGFGIFAVNDIGEVLITNLAYFKKSCSSANITLLPEPKKNKALATRLLSVFLSRRMQETFFFEKKCKAKSLIPFSLITTSGFNLRMSSQIFWTYSSSSCISLWKSSPLVSSMFVWLSPFWYCTGVSRRTILGFSIRRRIVPLTTSLLNITPLKTLLSFKSPPGIFSTLA
mmetsp:Transcript_30233/g.115937  ORF Transcript_30233/g.115937 Transcript_30233/m.115937 type:complete len:218 (+) Transcript_30233:1056-1709(+)